MTTQRRDQLEHQQQRSMTARNRSAAKRGVINVSSAKAAESIAARLLTDESDWFRIPACHSPAAPEWWQNDHELQLLISVTSRLHVRNDDNVCGDGVLDTHRIAVKDESVTTSTSVGESVISAADATVEQADDESREELTAVTTVTAVIAMTPPAIHEPAATTNEQTASSSQRVPITPKIAESSPVQPSQSSQSNLSRRKRTHQRTKSEESPVRAVGASERRTSSTATTTATVDNRDINADVDSDSEDTRTQLPSSPIRFTISAKASPAAKEVVSPARKSAIKQSGTKSTSWIFSSQITDVAISDDDCDDGDDTQNTAPITTNTAAPPMHELGINDEPESNLGWELEPDLGHEIDQITDFLYHDVNFIASDTERSPTLESQSVLGILADIVPPSPILDSQRPNLGGLDDLDEFDADDVF